jgi:hypothetical protein
MLIFNPVDCSGRREDSIGMKRAGETPQEQSDEEAHRTPQEEFAHEKAGSWAFHNSSEESEAPGMKINSLF